MATPNSNRTRPTSDRIRESLFSILGAQVTHAKILDLFAGTGALGLEALSRDAAHCCFVEKDKVALRALRKNLELVPNASFTLYSNEAVKTLKILSRESLSFDIIFVDPPYEGEQATQVSLWLKENPLLNPEGILIYEHSSKKTVENQCFGLEKKDSRIFGDTALSFFMR